MEAKLENFINLLAKSSLNYHDFLQKAGEIEQITDLIEPKDLHGWDLLGLELVRTDTGKIELATRNRDFGEQTFCVVDTETNGGIRSGQIIEIGAVKICGGVEIGRFETFVAANEIPENIVELTGITLADLDGAPSLASVMERFRLFLGDAVFVAHNVRFDYDFVSASMEKCGFGMLLNRRLCTIELARRTIPSQKYGLGTLKELLGIVSVHHRALSDALAAADIMAESLRRLPWTVQSVEDLIAFSKTAKSVKLPPQPIVEPVVL